MDRREFLNGMAGILAAQVAPAAIGSGILMPVRQIIVPEISGTFLQYLIPYPSVLFLNQMGRPVRVATEGAFQIITSWEEHLFQEILRGTGNPPE